MILVVSKKRHSASVNHLTSDRCSDLVSIRSRTSVQDDPALDPNDRVLDAERAISDYLAQYRGKLA
jgi:hypothetical protein